MLFLCKICFSFYKYAHTLLQCRIIIKMSGREDGQMHLTSQDRSSMRAKVVLGVVVCLCVLAAAAVAAVVVTTSSSRNGNEAAHSVARSLETLPESDSIDTDLDYLQTGDEHRVRREARRHRRCKLNSLHVCLKK